MVNVTKKYQVTIPKDVREDLNISQGDKVVFVKNRDGNWVMMTVNSLTSKMIESSKDVQKPLEDVGDLKPIKELSD